jgi:hypothetical protein
MVVGGHMYGIYLADGSVDIQATMIEAVQAQLLDGAFGDALGVASLTPDAMVSVANVNGSRFEGNSGAGALLWGATLTFGGNTFECNDVDLKAVENYGGLDNPVTITDDGNNDCGCLEVTRACGVAEAIAN